MWRPFQAPLLLKGNREIELQVDNLVPMIKLAQILQGLEQENASTGIASPEDEIEEVDEDDPEQNNDEVDDYIDIDDANESPSAEEDPAADPDDADEGEAEASYASPPQKPAEAELARSKILSDEDKVKAKRRAKKKISQRRPQI